MQKNCKTTVTSIPKKIAMINDIAGFGRCSTTVSLPIISAMGVQVCPVPTSVFSNHTGFPTYQFLDLTENMSAYLAQWEAMKLTFSGIYCGFLGSMSQIEIVRNFLGKHKGTDTLIIIDPVMGDNGKAYSTITKEHCEEMKRLLDKADILTPNLTEACLLTDTAFHPDVSEEELAALALKLHSMGPEKIVITGIEDGTYFYNYISETGTPPSVYRSRISGQSRSGTGDVFASILAGGCVTGMSLCDAVKKAADFVRICTEEATALGVALEEGVCFENHLHLLVPGF